MLRLPGLIPPLLRFDAGADKPRAVLDTVQPRMATKSCKIDGRAVTYGCVEGSGPTVLLIHGWGLSHHSYAAGAEALADQGFRVLSPDLPGFGDSKDLPYDRINFPGFAMTLHKFLSAVRREGTPVGAPIEPVHIVGHSFGGAVAVQVAHDDPDLVRGLVLVDASSGSIWHRAGDDVRLVVDRPIWDWGLHLLSEFPLGDFPTTSMTVLRDLTHNVVWHPFSLGMVAHLIRHTDVHAELSTIAKLGVPISVVWANGDRVVTRAEFDDQCTAAGCTGTEVDGNHGWLINDPAAFGRTLGEVLKSAGRRRTATRSRTSVATRKAASASRSPKRTAAAATTSVGRQRITA